MASVKETLDVRLATGEISVEEYEKILSKLNASSRPAASNNIPAYYIVFLVLFGLVAGEGQSLFFALAQDPTIWSFLAAMLMVVPAWVIFGISVYKMWKFISLKFPDEEGVISPATAVGYLFVPLFNIYWIFPVLLRPISFLYKDSEKTVTIITPIVFIGSIIVITILNQISGSLLTSMAMQTSSLSYSAYSTIMLILQMLAQLFIILAAIYGTLYFSTIRNRIAYLDKAEATDAAK